MEESASANSPALLEKLIALARRGAFLQKTADGADILTTLGHRRPGPTAMARAELDQALAYGLVRVSGPAQFVLTRRGKAVVRRARGLAAVAAARSPVAKTRHAPIPARAATATAHAVPTIDVKESPLAWLRQRKDRDGKPLIAAIEFEAGEKLREDFWFAQMTPRVTASWSGVPGDGQRRLAPGTGIDIADNVIAARERVNRALAAVGPTLAGVLVDVCCHLKGLEELERGRFPQRSGKVVLQIALEALAHHYGLDRRGREGLRHWGSPGYRSELDRRVDGG